MNLNLLKSLLVAIAFSALAFTGTGQNVIYSDTFTQSTGYTTGSSQWNGWVAFRAKLDTTNQKFLKLTMKGTFDQTGRTCNNPTAVRRIAQALLNAGTESVTCNGYTWLVGNCGTGPELNVGGSICACNGGWCVRPMIGTSNPNWGGVNSNTCSGPTQRLTVIFEKPSKPNEMGISGFTALNLCTNVQSIVARISNYGTNYIDSFRVYWSVNNVLQTPIYITSHLKSGLDTVKTLNPSFTLTNNTTYTFKVWTSLPNGKTDSIPANDTLRYTFSFLGNPSPPTTTNFIQCGIGKPTLKATPSSPSDTILWYDASVGGNMLGVGKTITGPSINSTKTFYAQGMRFGGSVKFNNGFNGTTILSGSTTIPNGGMFNVTANNLVSLDSITIRTYQFNANTRVNLYYKTGVYAGFQTTPTAWTLLYSGTTRNWQSGGKYYCKMPTKGMTLSASQTYAFYITTDPTSGGGNDLFATNGFITTSNTDLSIIGGTFVYGNWGANGLYSPYTIDVELESKKTCSNPTRTPLTVTVKPRPTGADIIKGTTFQGQFRAGDLAAPDITEVGKTIIYEIVPPTGFSNAGHTNTWVVNGVTARTRYGTLVPSTEYTVNDPSSSGPGTITFKPKSTWIDSFIVFSINYSDLGPYFCDSTIKRVVVIAPTPRPNFKFPVSICLGDAVLFDNTSTIHSGNMSFTWDFDNNDSSDLQSPVYEYKLPGSYNVRLRAKSSPWNVIHDTIIKVDVGELPATAFKVNNKCQGLAVTFQNQTVVANGALTYDWDFGDGTPHSTVVNPSHLYATPGGYKVTLKSTANGCISTLVKSAYMFARPVANFAAPIAPICAGTEVLMPNTSTILLGQQGAYWSYGDGVSSTSFHGNHIYTLPGTYAVKLLAVSEFDCKDSIVKSATIKPTPNPDFNGNQFCGRIPTIFTNNTFEAIANPIYNWTFSDNFTSALKNVTRTWPYEGPFSATLKATYNNGCSASTTKDFTVQIQPDADFTVQDICSGETAKFVNKSKGDRGGIDYLWNFGNNTPTSTLLAPTTVYNPNTTVTYTVTLVASYPGACSDTARKTITVSESPKCDFSFKDLGFKNILFTPANGGYTKYEWLFGDGGSSTAFSPTYKYDHTGNFEVTLKTTNAAGCTCEFTRRSSVTLDVNSLNSSNGVNIYPNPNNGTFTITNADNNSMKVEIFNVLGSKVYSKTSGDGTLVVNMQDNAIGIYLVKVTINGVTTTTRITVTN